MDNKKLNNAECVYGFAAWLTTRDEVTKAGGSEDCSPICERVGEFIKENNLGEVSEDWPNNLIHPSGQCSKSV